MSKDNVQVSMIKDKLKALQASLALLSSAKDFTLMVKDNEDNKYVLVFCDYGNELEIVKDHLLIQYKLYEKLKSKKDE